MADDSGPPDRGATIRVYRPGDEQGLADLVQASFPTWPKVPTSVAPADHMLWKLSSNPDSMRFQVVAEADEKIVGCRLFFLAWFRIRGERLFCRQGFDLAIHPDYQKRGILNDMWFYAREHFDDQNDFNFGVGAHPAALHMRVAQGNIVIENEVQVLVRALRGRPGTPAPDVDVRQVECFDERTDALFEATVPSFDFIRERTSAYLNWRFADRRAGVFTILQAFDGEDVLGYTVLCRYRETGIIADMLVHPDRLDALDALIRAALARFAQDGCSAAESWMPTVHPYRSVLLQNGFSHKKRDIHISYRYLRAPASQLEFLTDRNASVHIMAADTDLV